MLSFLGLLVVIFAVFGSSQAGLADDYVNHTRLDTKNESDATFMLYWTYNKNDSTISFAAEAKSMGGWVGLGFTNVIDNTTTYDVVRGAFDDFAQSNKMEVFDFHAVGTQTPVNDTQQNLMEKSAMKRGNTHVIIKFKRLLDTQDANDTVIKRGPMIVLWSYGNTVQLLSPSVETGHKTVTLIPVEDRAPTAQTPTTTPTVGGKAGSYQVSWLLLVLSIALFLVSGFSP